MLNGDLIQTVFETVFLNLFELSNFQNEKWLSEHFSTKKEKSTLHQNVAM